MPKQEDKERMEARTRAVGKSVSRTLRRDGEVPAVVYGHGEPIAIAVKEPEARRILALPPNRVFPLHISAEDGRAKAEQVRLKAVSHEPTTSRVLHIDFQRVVQGERLRAPVPVRVSGAEELRRRGLVLEHLMNAVEVEADATLLPEHVEIDVAAMDAGDARTVADLVWPADVTVISPADAVVIHVTYARVEAAEAAAAPAGAAQAEEEGSGG